MAGRMKTPPETRACGVFLVRGKPIREFLLLRHADRWDLAKGHVEPGETDRQCALREMTEETGFAADEVELDPDFRFTTQYHVRYKRFGDQDVLKTVVIYLGYVTTGRKLALTEHLDAEWFPWAPPHQIQVNTIDPLIAAVAQHVAGGETE